ncbi:hypothetical protein COO60DRAFT_1672918 [Scenedesmus sp. NREL 46B-D3]|nr:hypothetical protein COO60DRAFT_1672918 [Scenedesmus sp. NREL 46B-D3]
MLQQLPGGQAFLDAAAAAVVGEPGWGDNVGDRIQGYTAGGTIRAAAQFSGSSLPPEVLQQAGLQLLQALAAPLQLGVCEGTPELREVFGGGCLDQQLCALLAAGSGLPSVEEVGAHGGVPPGQQCVLAAAAAAAVTVAVAAADRPLQLQCNGGGSSSGRSSRGSSSSDPVTEDEFTDLLQLCRALAAAAPLPVVRNNPGCENLAGAGDWRRHKHACRHMAAAGEVCK